MEPKEYIPVLNEIEQRYNVSNWILEGYYIWPVIRVGIGFALDSSFKKVIKDSLYTHISNLFRDTFNFFYANLVDKSKNAKLKKSKYVFFTLTEERSTFYDQKWFNNYCDPIRGEMEKVSEKTFFIEYSSKGRYKIPRYSESYFVQFFLNMRSIFAVIFMKKIKPEKLVDFLLVEQFLLLHTDLEKKTIQKIFNRISVIRIWANYLKHILKIINPEIGFVVSYYGPYGMAFLLACHELGIPTVDLQHGVQGNSNVAYAEWINPPSNGYELIPKVFWVWNENDHLEKLKWLSPNGIHKSYLGGNLLLEQFKDKNSNISRYFSSHISSLVKGKKKTVLITLQPSNGLQNFKRIISEAPKEFYFLIRLHPLMHSQMVRILSELNYLDSESWNLIQATNYPLYAILQYVDIHITESSATVIEAESFHVPSILIQKSSASFFESQIENGIVKVLDDIEMIFHEIWIANRRHNNSKNIEEESILKKIKNLEILISKIAD